MTRKTKGAKNRRLTEDQRIDESLKESFPASDPPSFSGTVAGGPPEEDAGTAQETADSEKSRSLTQDQRIDESLKGTFPASDPPAFSGTVAGGPRRKNSDAGDKKRQQR